MNFCRNHVLFISPICIPNCLVSCADDHPQSDNNHTNNTELFEHTSGRASHLKRVSPHNNSSSDSGRKASVRQQSPSSFRGEDADGMDTDRASDRPALLEQEETLSKEGLKQVMAKVQQIKAHAKHQSDRDTPSKHSPRQGPKPVLGPGPDRSSGTVGSAGRGSWVALDVSDLLRSASGTQRTATNSTQDAPQPGPAKDSLFDDGVAKSSSSALSSYSASGSSCGSELQNLSLCNTKESKTFLPNFQDAQSSPLLLAEFSGVLSATSRASVLQPVPSSPAVNISGKPCQSSACQASGLSYLSAAASASCAPAPGIRPLPKLSGGRGRGLRKLNSEDLLGKLNGEDLLGKLNGEDLLGKLNGKDLLGKLNSEDSLGKFSLLQQPRCDAASVLEKPTPSDKAPLSPTPADRLASRSPVTGVDVKKRSEEPFSGDNGILPGHTVPHKDRAAVMMEFYKKRQQEGERKAPVPSAGEESRLVDIGRECRKQRNAASGRVMGDTKKKASSAGSSTSSIETGVQEDAPKLATKNHVQGREDLLTYGIRLVTPCIHLKYSMAVLLTKIEICC